MRIAQQQGTNAIHSREMTNYTVEMANYGVATGIYRAEKLNIKPEGSICRAAMNNHSSEMCNSCFATDNYKGRSGTAQKKLVSCMEDKTRLWTP